MTVDDITRKLYSHMGENDFVTTLAFLQGISSERREALYGQVQQFDIKMLSLDYYMAGMPKLVSPWLGENDGYSPLDRQRYELLGTLYMAACSGNENKVQGILHRAQDADTMLACEGEKYFLTPELSSLMELLVAKCHREASRRNRSNAIGSAIWSASQGYFLDARALAGVGLKVAWASKDPTQLLHQFYDELKILGVYFFSPLKNSLERRKPWRGG
ncbi:hypothetical protein HYX12_04405 [Candidatus Woesearchaeota archaeon]|nr:hypothetical protein [Candidatus Woesearchaeota archaeon]